MLLKIFCFLLISHGVVALNILAIITVPVRSHFIAFQPFFHELAVRGHNVTVMNNYPEKNSPLNLKFIDLRAQVGPILRDLRFFEKIDSNYVRFWNIYNHIIFKGYQIKFDCECLLENEDAIANLREGNRYDVVFVEQWKSDCGLAYALTLYDAPIIGIAAHILQPMVYPRMGLPFDAANEATYFSDSGPNPTLLQKVESYLIHNILKTVGRWYLQTNVYEVFDRFIPNNTLNIEMDAKNRMQMIFTHQHFSATGVRLLPPQVLPIGGIHIGVPKPVSQEIEEFLSDAEHGAIYVSFGSNLKASTMSEKKRQHFLTAFRRIPQKVIWKYEDAPFQDKKILTASWFSQLDILCHPKVLAFVSHGGMLSISESAHCGKPILTVPFFGDQFSNSAAVRSVGLGKTLYFDKIDADNLEEAIKDLTSDELQQNAQRVSRLWHDRPQPVMDSAIYWTEYVARHKTAPPSLPAKHNTWFESTLIDVYIVLLVILAGIFLLIRAVLRVFLIVLTYVVGLFSSSVVVEKKKKKGKSD